MKYFNKHLNELNFIPYEVVFPLSKVVIALTLVVLTLLGTSLTSLECYCIRRQPRSLDLHPDIYDGNVYRSYSGKSVGASIQCLKDWLFDYLTICGWASG